MSETAPPEAPAIDPETPETAPVEKPTETVDFWKKQARDNEKRAKDNATAAQRLQEIEDAQKTAEQKSAEEAQRAQTELAQMRAENLRLKKATEFKVGSDYYDLLGDGDEEQITDRATRVGSLLEKASRADALQAELDALKQGSPATPTPRPVESLKPGATPAAAPVAEAAYPADWLPKPAQT